MSNYKFKKCEGPDFLTRDKSFKYSGKEDAVIVPDETVSITSKSFKSLKAIRLGKNVSKVNNNCVEWFEVDSSNPYLLAVDGVLYDKTGKTIIAYPCLLNETEFIIPDSVTTISRGAFLHSNLKSIVFNKSINRIGEEAFSWMLNLTNINWPEKARVIKPMTFFSCKNLSSISIPDGVIIIGEKAFASCKSLLTLSIPDSVVKIGELAFHSCEKLKSVKLPSKLEVITRFDFDKCYSLESVTLPAKLKKICYDAFSECRNLKKLFLPDGLIFIGRHAMKESGIDRIVLPNSVQRICTLLEDVKSVSQKKPSKEFLDRIEASKITVKIDQALASYSSNYSQNRVMKSLLEERVKKYDHYQSSGHMTLTEQKDHLLSKYEHLRKTTYELRLKIQEPVHSKVKELTEINSSLEKLYVEKSRTGFFEFSKKAQIKNDIQELTSKKELAEVQLARLKNTASNRMNTEIKELDNRLDQTKKELDSIDAEANSFGLTIDQYDKVIVAFKDGMSYRELFEYTQVFFPDYSLDQYLTYRRLSGLGMDNYQKLRYLKEFAEKMSEKDFEDYVELEDSGLSEDECMYYLSELKPKMSIYDYFSSLREDELKELEELEALAIEEENKTKELAGSKIEDVETKTEESIELADEEIEDVNNKTEFETSDKLLFSDEKESNEFLLDSEEEQINSTISEPPSSLNNLKICLTGEFSYGTKAKVEDFIVAHGGKCVPNVTNSTNMLLIGEKGSKAYSYGTYGNKYEKALTIPGISILKEKEFFELYENAKKAVDNADVEIMSEDAQNASVDQPADLNEESFKADTISGNEKISFDNDGPFWEPGKEPVVLREKLSNIFEQLDSAYPDKVIVKLQNNHPNWALRVKIYSRALGYPDTHTFFTAYGYHPNSAGSRNIETVKPNLELDNAKSNNGLSNVSANQDDITPVWKPGFEPQRIRILLNGLFEKLDEVYPEKDCTGLSNDNPRLAEEAQILSLTLNYSNSADFLTAYGYRFAKGRPSANHNEIIDELKRRYPNGAVCSSVAELAQQNPDLAPKFKNLQNRSIELFGTGLVDYLVSEGIITDNSRRKMTKDYYQDQFELLKSRYQITPFDGNLAKLKENNPDINWLAIEKVQLEKAPGTTIKKFLIDEGILQGVSLSGKPLLDYIVEELKKKYSGATKFEGSIEKLKEENPDIPLTQLWSLTKKIYNMSPQEYLEKEGILAEKLTPEDKLAEITAALKEHYADGWEYPCSLSEVVKQNPDINLNSLNNLTSKVFNMSASDYLYNEGIIYSDLTVDNIWYEDHKNVIEPVLDYNADIYTVEEIDVYGDEANEWVYEVVLIDDTQTVYVSDYSGIKEHIIVPSSINGTKVSGLLRTHGTFPPFAKCKANIIEIPGCIKIVDSDFGNNNCNIRELVIGEGVTTFGFGKMDNLIKISASKSLVNITNSEHLKSSLWFENEDDFVIIGSVFLGIKKRHTTVNIPKGVKTINKNVFNTGWRYLSHIKTIVIPESVNEIQQNAFSYSFSKVEHFNIANNIVKIGKDAFGYRNLYTSGLLASNEWIAQFEDGPIVINHILNSAYIEKKDGYIINRGTRVFTVPEDVIYIGDFAFEDRSTLGSVVIPEGVKEIRKGAFKNCISLTEVSLPSTLEIIEDNAFENCSKLHNIKLPENLCSIGKNSFSHCTELKEINLPESLEYIGSAAFEYCSSLDNVQIPRGVKKINNEVFSNCTSLKTVLLPDSLEYIGERAFNHCKAIESITIPEEVRYIGNDAFSNCPGLLEVTMPKENPSLGINVFYGNNNIGKPEGEFILYGNTLQKYTGSGKDIIVPNGISIIDSDVVTRKTLANQFIIPDSVVTIAPNAFSKVKREDFTVPCTVKFIGKDAFSGIYKLSVYDCLSQFEVPDDPKRENDYYITILSSENGYIKSNLYISPNGTEQYYDMVRNAWNDVVRFDYDLYDEFFLKSRCPDRVKMAFNRLRYPLRLSEYHRKCYTRFLESCMYIERGAIETATEIAKFDDIDCLRYLYELKAIYDHNFDLVSSIITNSKAKQCSAFITQIRR